MINKYRNCINQTYDSLLINKEYLNNLDQQLGDGDHGSTILKGMIKAREIINETKKKNLSEIMTGLSSSMRNEMGGASGILTTIFFDESGKINVFKLNETLLQIFNSTTLKIIKRGKVNVGDKSILDIYYPINEYIKENFQNFNQNKKHILELLEKSVFKTKGMKAKVGRAKFLSDKGIGYIDPGDKSSENILKNYFNNIL